MRDVIPLSLLFFLVATVGAESQPPANMSARSLDALLQSRAFVALSLQPKTGVVCKAQLPKNLTGIGVSAVRLRSGSLRTRGVARYGEFGIPVGVEEQPYTRHVALVYHNFGNLSSRFYPLPGFEYLAPVLGLIAYNASNLTAVGLPELELRAPTKRPIVVRFGGAPRPSSARCVFFDLHGGVQFDKLVYGNQCEIVQQGHVTVAVEAAAPAPPPKPEGDGEHHHEDKSKVGNIVLFLVGAVALLVGIGFSAHKYRAWKKNKESGKSEGLDGGGDGEGGEGEASGGGGSRSGGFDMSSFAGIKAPFARMTRTRPALEEGNVR